MLSQLCLTLCDPMDSGPPGSCPWGYFGQEDWSVSPCPPQGDLPNPGIKPKCPTQSAGCVPSEPPGKPMAFKGQK